MFQKTLYPLTLWQFANLSGLPEVNHFVSGKEGGVSENGTLNLSFKVGDEPDNVEQNRKLIASALCADVLLFPEQTHSVNVQIVDANSRIKNLTDTDAIISNASGLCIAVMSADCVPVLLYDPVTKTIGAVHSGWKGTVGRLVEKTVRTMSKEFGVKPSDLVVGIGPSICPDVYEVGEEVISAVKEAFGTINEIITPSAIQGKGFFNLWEANKRQLIELGVSEKNIEIAGICTYTYSDQFFSARKTKITLADLLPA